jgi:hypothetical protein
VPDGIRDTWFARRSHVDSASTGLPRHGGRPVHASTVNHAERSTNLTKYVCVTCGTQFADTPKEPDTCPVCDDDRQYVGPHGQQWTTLERLQEDHHTVFKPIEAGLTGVGVDPSFGIGQRALLVETPEGNVLWDCISLIDRATVAAVRDLGGIGAIAISHPHYYTSMVEWSRTFNAPIFLHAEERGWVMRPDDSVVFWEGETYPLLGGTTLIRCGGHFPGSLVLHWPAGCEGQGAMLTGDTIQVVADRRFVSFMYSYPNQIPLPSSAIRRITSAVEPFAYDRIYGAWWPAVIPSGARAAVIRSADRYVAALEGRHQPGQPPSSRLSIER